jgi:hypothetical protein
VWRKASALQQPLATAQEPARQEELRIAWERDAKPIRGATYPTSEFVCAHMVEAGVRCVLKHLLRKGRELYLEARLEAIETSGVAILRVGPLLASTPLLYVRYWPQPLEEALEALTKN